MMRGLDIAFFGSSLVSAYWNGAATYYRGIVKALHARGCRVTFYEPDAYGRQQHRDMADPPWARVVVYPGEGEAGVLNALEDAVAADVVIKASGVGVFDELLERAVLDLKRSDTQAIFWDVDAPATLERVHAKKDDPFRALIPRYDCILTYGGGEPVIAAYRALGARDCVAIYNAVDPSEHRPAPPDPRFEAMLGFMASRLPDREARVEEFFLQPAAALPQHRFLLGGTGWSDRPVPNNVELAGHVYGSDHNVFNSTPRAILNVNRDSMARFGFSPPTRVFEAAGAAACVITDRWDGISQFLEPEREILVADDGGQVVDLLLGLSAQRAQQIGQRARQRVLAQHTYEQRVALLATILEGSDRSERREKSALEPREGRRA
jgi:spore maturation protein CgeB